MAPRSRSRKAAAADEATFDPNATTPVTETEGEFYDSAQDHVKPLDEDGDGSTDDNEPSFVEDIVGDDPEAEAEADDPSAGQPLGRTTTGMSQGQQSAQAELKDYLRRRSNLEEERHNITADIKELDSEMKSKGYDMKAMKIIFKLAEMDEGDRNGVREQKLVNKTYAQAAGIDEDLV